MIINSGREEEFKDIMPILSKNIILQKVEYIDFADIYFRFSSIKDIKCPTGSNACILLKTQPVVVFLENIYLSSGKDNKDIMQQKKETLLIDIIHELGHYFALTDQYIDDTDTSAVYSTFNRMGNYDSIMASVNFNHLTCDDVDGFINLIDLTSYLENKKWSARARKGWASFCNGKKNGLNKEYKDEFYKEAKLLNKPYHVMGLYAQTFDEQGDLNGYTIIDPLDLYNKEFTTSVVGFGMAHIMTDTTNNIRYSYTYKGFLPHL